MQKKEGLIRAQQEIQELLEDEFSWVSPFFRQSASKPMQWKIRYWEGVGTTPPEQGSHSTPSDKAAATDKIVKELEQLMARDGVSLTDAQKDTLVQVTRPYCFHQPRLPSPPSPPDSSLTSSSSLSFSPNHCSGSSRSSATSEGTRRTREGPRVAKRAAVSALVFISYQMTLTVMTPSNYIGACVCMWTLKLPLP